MTTAVCESLEPIHQLIERNQLEKAAKALDEVAVTDENRCDVLFLRGRWQERSYDRQAARDTYEEVLKMDPDHRSALFHAALLEDASGNDDAAIELYERCTMERPAPVNAMVNLAVLYEDEGDCRAAKRCLESVLNEFPDHRRAAHFLKSVRSSSTMVYDEHGQQERERRSALLDMPISDFELSVRSRNCLRQMNIRSLSDLLRTSEPELLAYKNFGETSLNEIKALLHQKGLKLGQAISPPDAPALSPTEGIMPGPHPSNADRPVAELELSVRARKALLRLGVTTMGELAQKTEAELMAIKNFGQTSMLEIKGELAKYGLSFSPSSK